MSGNGRSGNGLHSFADFLARLDTPNAFSDNAPPLRQSSNPIEFLSFDEFLSRRDTLAVANNNSQKPQGKKNAVALPMSRQHLQQRNIMADWRGNTNDRSPNHHSTSLLPENVMESDLRSTSMTGGDMNNTTNNNNIATATSDNSPVSDTERDIFAFLDGLDDVDPPNDKNMGVFYGRHYRNASSALTASSAA
ncbi:hypothetical protein PG994_008829 [Apiospora phragmitis]|uniref:Uncharacterized protein n=1 Tax=Apiospora phragmitis TaxID=2905665 RepID=A0ABR1UHJ4_9PEZI